MATAIFGRKKHMTQAFQDDGTLVGVTVIEVEPNFVTAVRTADEDGYDAVQVGFGTVPTLEVVAVVVEKNELWVRGGVPGGKGSVVKIRKAGESGGKSAPLRRPE